MQDQVQHLLGRIAHVQHGRDRSDPGQVLLQAGDRFLFREGHELDNEAAGLADRIVMVHQDAQSYRGRNLLRFRVVIGQVIGDLTAVQGNLSHIGILQAQVPDDGQGSAAYCPAHIQMTLGVGRQDDHGIGDIAFDVTMVIRGDRNALQGTVAADLNGQQILVIFQHIRHHQGPAHGPAQGRCRDRAGIVGLSGRFRQLSGGDSKSPDLGVCRCRSYKVIFIFCHSSVFLLSFLYFLFSALLQILNGIREGLSFHMLCQRARAFLWIAQGHQKDRHFLCGQREKLAYFSGLKEVDPAGIDTQLFGLQHDMGRYDGSVLRAGIEYVLSGISKGFPFIECEQKDCGGAIDAGRCGICLFQGFRTLQDIDPVGLGVFGCRRDIACLQDLLQLILFHGFAGKSLQGISCLGEFFK